MDVMKQNRNILLLAILVVLQSCNEIEPPKPIGPIPSERQLAWHELEYYAFIHFNMNTFTNMEWGTGGEKPAQFNPSELDARQWAKVAKRAGMKGIIITAKHHDGFCLWPTKTTEHSVKKSPWKNGEGDLLKDLSEACKEFDLKFGVYLSPWDRNHGEYGSAGYVTDFHEQLRELLTNYGDIFEVWFDGANGGSGYYGGANETRKIDNKTYYQWDKVEEIVRELQPNAVIFSDGGPDIRWVGNEEGWANETNWSIMRRDEIHPGWPRYVELRSGHEDGTHWLPAEVDVSIRPGWYYHAAEDHQVKTLPKLLDIYYHSVGRNASFLLNLPVDDRGLVHESDEKQLYALRKQLDADFATELAKNAKVSATDERGSKMIYLASKVNDGDTATYWATNDSVNAATLEFKFEEPTEINRMVLQEYIPLGQRVKNFIVSAEIDGRWQEIDGQSTIGYKRILRFETVTTTKMKIQIMDAKGSIALSNVEMYRAPNLLTEPIIKRTRDGMVSLEIPDKSVAIYYTLDGSDPTAESNKYESPFLVDGPTTVKAITYDQRTKGHSEAASSYFDIVKSKWEVVHTTTGNMNETATLMDDDPETFWASDENVRSIQEVIIDLGDTHTLKGFTYWPIQERYPFGIITNFEFHVSNNDKDWKRVVRGEFANIVNSRLEQKVDFNPIKARYIKLRGIKVDGADYRTSFAEIGVITE